MFCSHCGNEIPDESKFCPECGARIEGASVQDAVANTVSTVSNAAEDVYNNAKNAFSSAGKSVDSAVSEVADDINGTRQAGGPLKTDRSLISYILLSLITCGIYGYYFIYTVARDMNIACDDDEETAGLGMYILLSFVTCGFYCIYWEYKLGNRIADNAPKYGYSLQENGTTIVMWRILGSLICGIGTFVGSHILIKNVNRICEAYNRKHGFM